MFRLLVSLLRARLYFSWTNLHLVPIILLTFAHPLLTPPPPGLDAYNAHNVIASLVSLARNYNRTVVFTIHQPRSNIVAMFDKLVLLAKGKMVYSGDYVGCQEYFGGVGMRCPEGYNLADYLSELFWFFWFGI